jgi:glucose/arabinose dehydrogenase
MSGGMRVRTRIALLASCLLGLLAAAAPSAGAIELQSVGTFSAPVYMTSPPGDSRLFVVQRGGRIQVVHDGVTSQFLDIHLQTTTDVERGLLSMAFDPNYASNGLFYVFYTSDGVDSDGALGDGHVDEFHVSTDPNVADAASQRRVLTITRPGTAGNHNGGQLQFGKDGYLYISVGDGGTGGATAPDLTLLNGKLLRIDPHGTTPGEYTIPADNPFVSSDTARHEIWASGFRNPWRFSFDRATGDLVVGDVGQVTWEEIDFAPTSLGLGRGVDWGWPACEGFYDQGTSDTCSATGVTAPAFAYPHSDPGGDVATGCAVMGGYTYRGNQIPELAGRYLYADHCHGEVRSMQLGSPLASGDRAESAPGALNQPDSFGEDASCNLYVTSGATVYELVSSSPPAVSAACEDPPPETPTVPTTPSTPATPGPSALPAKKACKKRHGSSAKKHRKRCKKRKTRR